ncbi:hypothetical protein [Kitasatospora sp. NPDC057223]|uniref:hypothetical protein n=1 Tax=Kitasatospora sp. NPDC057223 TaxID=3346055 RepID=UPI003626ADB7
MTTVALHHPGHAFDGRRVLTATTELVDSYRHSGQTVEQDIARIFVAGGRWTRIGPDVHTTGLGNYELRLRSSAEGWHADTFGAGWGEHEELGTVPPEHRHAVAVYIDARDRLTPDRWPHTTDLHERNRDGGISAAHALITHHLGLLDDQLRTIDALQTSIPETERRKPWAARLLTTECRHVAELQGRLATTLLEFHLGTTGLSPNLDRFVPGFDLPGGFIPLEYPRPARNPETNEI